MHDALEDAGEQPFSPSLVPLPLQIVKCVDQQLESKQPSTFEVLCVWDQSFEILPCTVSLPIFPPRSSSMGAARSVKIHPQVAAQSQANSQAASIITSHSPYHRNYSQDSSFHRHSATTDQSSMSNTTTSRYHSDASSAIFGDFIPIDTSSMVDSYTESRSSHSTSNA